MIRGISIDYTWPEEYPNFTDEESENSFRTPVALVLVFDGSITALPLVKTDTEVPHACLAEPRLLPKGNLTLPATTTAPGLFGDNKSNFGDHKFSFPSPIMGRPTGSDLTVESAPSELSFTQLYPTLNIYYSR